MSRKYQVIKESQKMRTLLSIIKSNYHSDNKNSLQEVNLEHVLNRIFNQDIRNLVSSIWKDLEMLVGQEIRLLENNCKKSFINRFYKKSKDMILIVNDKAKNSKSDFVSLDPLSRVKLDYEYVEINR